MKRLLFFSTLFLFVFGIAEFGARYWLGLGTPPLSVSHPTIEYMFSPNQDVYRFGNHIIYNEYGMRSVAIEEVDQPHRVIVFGDSVVNGGSLTDHAALATSLATNSEVFYGNVSAGSWGPANIVAWIDEYGFLDSEAAILVISSHDLHDAPSFAPLNPKTHPSESPIFALWEGVNRYAPRYLPKIFRTTDLKNEAPKANETNTAGSIARFINQAQDAGVKLCAIQHKERKELEMPQTSDLQEISALFMDRGVPVLDLGSKLRGLGVDPYRDSIHLNNHGQMILANQLSDCYAAALVPKSQ